MLEVLITASIVAGVVAGVFVGLVSLMLFLAGVYAATTVVLDKLTELRNVWLPPKNQIEEAYKDYIQRIRETMVYGAPVFVMTKEEKGR